jgi:hypothetical protein
LKRHLPLAVALLMAGAQAALLVATARDKSDTVDEDIDLPAAAILWAHRDFGVNPDSPVLPKWRSRSRCARWSRGSTIDSVSR